MILVSSYVDGIHINLVPIMLITKRSFLLWMKNVRLCLYIMTLGNLFLDRILGGLALVQLVEQPTWRRVVNQVVKESVLDHVYVNYYYQVKTVEYVWPIFGE